MRTIQLGQLFELKYGKSLHKDSRIHGEVPVYGSNGTVGFHNESLVNKPTIVVGRKGSIGEVHLVSTPCWPIDTTYFVESLGKFDYELEWLFRLLKTLRLQNLNRSAAIPGLNRDDVYRIEILLLPLDDQKRIAHLLGKVEGLIARRKQHLQQLDDLLKSVFLEMFGEPVRNEKVWETKNLGDIATIERGRFSPRPRNDPKFYNGSYPFIQTGDISRSNGRLSEYTQTLNDLGIKVSKEFKTGTIVIAIVGATIGETAILEIPTYAPDSVIGITPKIGNKNVESVFMEYVLRFWKPVLKAKAPEAARANINIETLRPLPIIWPPSDNRIKFATVAEKVESLKSRYQQSLTDLESLYGVLSQKAFKGELDLSRVVLPAEGPSITGGEKTDIEEKPMEPLFGLSAPEDLVLLQTTEGRKSLLGEWLNAWVEQLGDKPFAAQDFMEAARQRLWELAEDDGPDWGAAEYDELKSLVFKALEQGYLTQGYDNANNRVQITAAKG